MSLARKSCSYLLLLPDEETLAQGSTVGSTSAADHDGQAYIGTPSGVIRCRTVRQLSAQERWDTEFVLSTKGTPWSPDGERAGDVNIRVEAGGDRGVHPPDIEPPTILARLRLTREMFERFCLTTQCLGCRAKQELGTRQNHTERCRERIEQELEKEPEGASRVARDRERELSEPGTRSVPGT